MRIALFANLIGAALTLISLNLPWFSYNTGRSFSPLGFLDVGLVFLLAAGGILSLASKFGGIISATGVGIAIQYPPVHFLTTSATSFVYSIGLWVGLAGAIVSLLGQSWTLPVALPKTNENRRIVRLVLFPIGTISIILGFSILTSGASLYYETEPPAITMILGGLLAIIVSLMTLNPCRVEKLFSFFRSNHAKTSAKEKTE